MEHAMQFVQVRRPRAHVLVIDDDPDFRAFMRLLFDSESYDGTLAARNEVDDCGHSTRPDVVLCDPFVPLAPDFMLLERLAAAPSTRDVPVILCTGAVHLVDEARTRFAPDVTLLPKPFDVDDLIACIERARAGQPVGCLPATR
jgi:CheY-like chemotaxis protein